MDTILKFNKVQKLYEPGKGIKNISFNIKKGSVTGLLGKNGAGKSTLLKCAVGLLKAQEGKVETFGEDAWNLSSATKTRIGYVPQSLDASFYPWMSVGQLLEFTASFYKSWDMDMTKRLIQLWSIDLKLQVSALSGGQAQQLSIILALGHQPELILLDEPVASFDPVARRQFLSEILDVVTEKERTVLFSTHITSDLERIASNIIHLKDGKVEYDGELDELKESVKRIHIVDSLTFDAQSSFRKTPGILRCEVDGASASLTVKNYSPELHEVLERQHKAELRVEDLNLEDIFMELNS